MTSADYQSRAATINADGTPLFASDYDQANESAVSRAVEVAWKCELHHFGRLCPLDFYATRHGRLVGVLELKSRAHASGKYPTVFLNVRKWIALMLAQTGLGAPAIFVVKFLDCVRFIPVAQVDASRVRIGGTARIVKSHTDVEPVIEVPIDGMKLLEAEHRP